MLFVRILIRSILAFYILFFALIVYQGTDGDLFKTAERFFQSTHFITGIVDYFYPSTYIEHDYSFFILQLKFTLIIFILIYSILLAFGLYRLLYDTKIYAIKDGDEGKKINEILRIESGFENYLFRSASLKGKEEDEALKKEKTFQQLMKDKAWDIRSWIGFMITIFILWIWSGFYKLIPYDLLVYNIYMYRTLLILISFQLVGGIIDAIYIRVLCMYAFFVSNYKVKI